MKQIKIHLPVMLLLLTSATAFSQVKELPPPPQPPSLEIKMEKPIEPKNVTGTEAVIPPAPPKPPLPPTPPVPPPPPPKED